MPLFPQFLPRWSKWLLCGLAGTVSVGAAGLSLDAGHTAANLAATIRNPANAGWWRDGWVRLRGMTRLPDPILGMAADPEWRGLEALDRAGLKPVVFYEPGTVPAAAGTRRPTGHPLDLREAYAYARAVAQAAYPQVAAWEIENEPDLYGTMANPEEYAAFLKAVALGLQAGSEAAERGAETSGFRNPKLQANMVRPPPPARPLILPGGLGLAPGPFFKQLEANDAFSYVDGLNFHYYSYPEDFSDEYRLFEDALLRSDGLPATGARRRLLPVFLTEYGYGLMSGEAARTVEGRVRQWRFFSVMAPQLQALGITGPMAFYMPPYFEAGTNEFGLGMARAGGGEQPGAGAGARRAGGLCFQPADFGLTVAPPWMRWIGTPVDDTEASPALAFLADQPAPRPRLLPALAAAPSPVVIDFVAGTGLVPLKSYQGQLLRAGAGRERTGAGELRIYNFSAREIRGRLGLETAPGLMAVAGPAGTGTLVLAPGAWLQIPVDLRIEADGFRGYEWRTEFVADDRRTPPARYATLLFPNAVGMRKETTGDFEHPAAAAESNRRLLLARPLAAEEPHLQAQGRWLVTDGVEVQEANGTWTFTVTQLPPQPLRPAMAELPLPAGFAIPADDMLLFDYRQAGNPTGQTGLSFDCYFRTETGNLFEALPRLKAGAAWQTFAQIRDNFSTVAFGRMKLPWRFSENQPAALVFFLRPEKLPAVLEVRHAELAAWRVGAESETLKR